ncbi:MAG TPA: hypothetical protein VGS22_12220 [Thermoanaerobaculia bacterium]|jgi:hypothetical protein|nr:hypothetical protein [Thermoanaerobaculia bacterium]
MSERGNAPRKGYLGRGLLVVIAFGGLSLVAVAGAGYRWFGDQRLHILLALIVSLLLVFAQSWISIYLVGTSRLIAKTVAAHGFEPQEDELRRRLVRRALPWLLLGAFAVLFAFLSGAFAMIRQGELYPRYWHHAIFFATLVLQFAALYAARPGLAETERRIRALDVRIGSSS